MVNGPYAMVIRRDDYKTPIIITIIYECLAISNMRSLSDSHNDPFNRTCSDCNLLLNLVFQL